MSNIDNNCTNMFSSDSNNDLSTTLSISNSDIIKLPQNISYYKDILFLS